MPLCHITLANCLLITSCKISFHPCIEKHKPRTTGLPSSLLILISLLIYRHRRHIGARCEILVQSSCMYACLFACISQILHVRTLLLLFSAACTLTVAVARSSAGDVGKFNVLSGGASAVKEPGHFEVRKSSRQVRSPRVTDAAKGSPDPVV